MTNDKADITHKTEKKPYQIQGDQSAGLSCNAHSLVMG